MHCQRRRIPHPASLYADTLLNMASSACATPCELRSGGYWHPMESFVGHLTPSSIILHARDGVWSCEGVMWPDHSTRIASTGFLTPRRLPLAAWMT